MTKPPKPISTSNSSPPRIAPAENTPVVRDTTPQGSSVPRLNTGANSIMPHQPGSTSRQPELRVPAIEIVDLPTDTHVRHASSERPIGSYFLAPTLVNRLPSPDVQSGFRLAGRYTYVDLVEGGTVLIGSDAQNQLRARSSNERSATGPLLERIEGTTQWRPTRSRAHAGADVSELVITRQRMERDPLEALLDPWKGWGIDAQHASADDISIGGIQYKVLPRGAASDPIAYIKNPSHMVYNFDLLDHTLRTDLLQQPRGAIRVPPANHWEVDPTLPFEGPLTSYVTRYFPELTAASLEKVALHQFLLANGSETATGSGLTLLRQTFNDWRVGNPHPRPQLADPLLMLPILPTSGGGIVRITELPAAASDGPLQRLDFEPMLFRQEWQYAQATQTAVDLKRFMAALLTRNGYAVFDPSLSNSYPALVFQRTGHDYVYFISLHRVRGRKINQTLNVDSNSSNLRLHIQVGARAAQAAIQAHAENRLIWLRGGSQVLASAADTIFIIRDAHSRL